MLAMVGSVAAEIECGEPPVHCCCCGVMVEQKSGLNGSRKIAILSHHRRLVVLRLPNTVSAIGAAAAVIIRAEVVVRWISHNRDERCADD